ncbi:glycoside hydrolase family 16 protein [Amanita thiersii Skay4041]|uniref:Glycoside hydrolase family 16 protein n=1 Tax=Amanita thiersii Skay4041 TaxID=703135 RepID=A0A2A9ND49_9AGAR|nr:glycoside hydrolase family 16 protein [Amanita thiersii Skay4041]
MTSPYMQRPSASATSLLSPEASTSRLGTYSSSMDDLGRAGSGKQTSLSDKYSLPPSLSAWGMPLLMNEPEPDDFLHNPDPRRDRKNDKGGHIFTCRGLANLGCMFVLAMGMLTLLARFPLISHFMKKKQTNQGGFNLGGINATGQVPDLGNWGLIDEDTPKEAYTKFSYTHNEELVLVFSDEFNTDGRSFYPGDDPYWEAVDLHYWGTNDLEWYDPQQATTEGGALKIKLEKVANTRDNHDLEYRSAMLQSWNKFCFTGGLIEAAVTLPGVNDVGGLWPALWTMGNLGRAGHGATTDGLWPFTYDSCDVGTLPNQTYPGTKTPIWAVQNGDPANNNELSFLPGQRLSACTCSGESHPGPVRMNGSYVGRGAPEIDVFEALVEEGVGKVSMSGQWAPFNAEYKWTNTSDNIMMYNETRTHLNPYIGGAFQQCTSGLSITNQDCYEREKGCYSVFGFEYKPGFDGYITWINDGAPSWSMFAPGMGADPRTEIGPRAIPQEPMYIIANLGFSLNFGNIDFDRLPMPTTMSIDWIRVYQPKDAVNIGCDPKEFPTKNYIDTYIEAYRNPNMTTWEQYGQSWPKNKLTDGCT